MLKLSMFVDCALVTLDALIGVLRYWRGLTRLDRRGILLGSAIHNNGATQ
jgi:hypothetical protein